MLLYKTTTDAVIRGGTVTALFRGYERSRIVYTWMTLYIYIYIYIPSRCCSVVADGVDGLVLISVAMAASGANVTATRIRLLQQQLPQPRCEK